MSKQITKIKKTNKHIQLSVIIPLPQLEPLIQTYRFQYNFFAKHGIPSHITLFFLFDPEIYYKNQESFDQTLSFLLKMFQKKKMTIDNFYQNPFMFALDFDKSSSDFINQIQLKLAKHYHLNIQDYQNITKRPHITLFTQRGDKKGFTKIPQIKKELTPLLPQKISFDRIWLLQIDTKKNIPTLIKEYSNRREP
jgi:2'-5' RNA ligase